MQTVENSKDVSSVAAYLEEQSALFRTRGYWNCLVAARNLSALLLAQRREPWIARLRKTEDRGGQKFHAPLIHRAFAGAIAWTTHYVCCCDDMAYDPVAGKAISLETYSMEVFGEQISPEVFVSFEDLAAYLQPFHIQRAG